MNVDLGTVIISYPDLGFAFNPIRISIESKLPGISYIVESNGIKIERESNEDLFYSYELSAVAQHMFDRFEFYKVNEYDTILLKELSFSVKIGIVPIFAGSIPILWGALQIGETYTQNKTLTYFKGFPFTVPLYTKNPISLKINGEAYKSFSAGKHNIDISDVSGEKIEISIFNEEIRSIFDYTFDYTFHNQKVLFNTGFKILVNVVDCPNEGVYLRWINKYGEYNYYLFENSDERSTISNNDIRLSNVYYTTDFTDNYHIGTDKSIGKECGSSIKIFAPLIDQPTFDFLIALAESPVVDLFIGYNEDNSQNWMSVSVEDGTFVKSTNSLQDFELFLIANKTLNQKL